MIMINNYKQRKFMNIYSLKVSSLIFSLFVFTSFTLNSTELTVSSYNCGGLSDHYDYLRAASMQKLMQERHMQEPENMALNEAIQTLALKILFAPEGQEKTLAQQEWERKGYSQRLEALTQSPTEQNSPNAYWYKKSEEIITPYNIRPIALFDEEVNQMLADHIRDLTQSKKEAAPRLLKETRALMAKRAFHHHLKQDIICLQEADYLNTAMFPSHYTVLFSNSSHSKNGVAWNSERFDWMETLGDILGRAFAVKLLDKESGSTIVVASAHITGCNPYRIENDPLTGKSDSARGDAQIQTIIELLDQQGADLMVIGMDSNVTSLHPRLNILKTSHYQLDYEHPLESTCTNPNLLLNTRIDWIALKTSKAAASASITNIPIQSVGLNNMQTNISDHKPIAAKIKY
jgi:hypothetical protein